MIIRKGQISCVSLKAFALLLVLCLVPSNLHSAEVKIIEKRNFINLDVDKYFDPAINAILQPPPRCNVRLSGLVKKGDLKKIKQAFKQVNYGQPGAPGYLCLSSAGGNYKEGLEIAKFLLSDSGYGISTVIEKSVECLSACALVFLAGNTPIHHGHAPGRWLHVKGRLGFHAPYIGTDTLPKKIYTKEEALNFFKTAKHSVKLLIKTFSITARAGGLDLVGMPWVRPSLFHETLEMGPEEIFYIDEIDKAGRWDISLYGYKKLKKLSNSAIRTACINVKYWATGTSAKKVGHAEIEESKIERKPANWAGSDGFRTLMPEKISITFPAFPQPKCILSVKKSTSGILANITFTNGDETDGLAHGVEWALYPPETKLTDIQK